MMCRLWHGWTTADDADESCLREELYPRLEHELSDRGYRGHHIPSVCEETRSSS